MARRKDKPTTSPPRAVRALAERLRRQGTSQAIAEFARSLDDQGDPPDPSPAAVNPSPANPSSSEAPAPPPPLEAPTPEASSLPPPAISPTAPPPPPPPETSTTTPPPSFRKPRRNEQAKRAKRALYFLYPPDGKTPRIGLSQQDAADRINTRLDAEKRAGLAPVDEADLPPVSPDTAGRVMNRLGRT